MTAPIKRSRYKGNIRAGSKLEQLSNVAHQPPNLGIWKCWFFRKDENRSSRRKTFQEKDENRQTETIFDVTPRLEPRPRITGKRAL